MKAVNKAQCLAFIDNVVQTVDARTSQLRTTASRFWGVSPKCRGTLVALLFRADRAQPPPLICRRYANQPNERHMGWHCRIPSNQSVTCTCRSTVLWGEQSHSAEAWNATIAHTHGTASCANPVRYVCRVQPCRCVLSFFLGEGWYERATELCVANSSWGGAFGHTSKHTHTHTHARAHTDDTRYKRALVECRNRTRACARAHTHTHTCTHTHTVSKKEP